MGHEAWSDDPPPPHDPYRPGEAPLGPGAPEPVAYGPDPAQTVKAPAICLIVFGVLFSLFSLCGVGQGVAMLAGVMPPPEVPPNMPADQQEFMEMYVKVVPITNVVLGFCGLATCVLAAFSGIKLLSLQGGGMAKLAAVLIMCPLWGCCCLGIPLGIWLLVVLGKPEVSAALR